ncbi:MAG: hypothetical protein IKC24_10195 [Oscillospiraceae bacterium]|nr:hypothetical protein [Oscillospiraceae bacterium]
MRILGISISNMGLAVSRRCGSDSTGTMVTGYDLTKPSWLSGAEVDRLKGKLEHCLYAFSTDIGSFQEVSDWKDASVVVAYPVGMDLVELQALKALFQRMDVKIHRYISASPARGLYLLDQNPDMDATVCCVGCDKDSVELSLIDIADGVVEEQCQRVYEDNAACNYALMEQKIRTLIREADDCGRNIDTLYLQYTKPPKQGCELLAMPGMRIVKRLDDFAASYGALVLAELIAGKRNDGLTLPIHDFEIFCRVNGGEKISILPRDSSIPTRREKEIAFTSPGYAELELFAESVAMGKQYSLFKKTFTMHAAGSIRVVFTCGADNLPMLTITAEGKQYRVMY